MKEQEATLISLLRNLDEDSALALVRRRLTEGEDPIRIMGEAQEGVRQVGLLYEEHRYFVSGLIMAGEILRQIVELIEPALEQGPSGSPGATILLGTVQGDIHDIGKNIVRMLLRCNGYTVVDLGVDVPAESFAEQTLRLRPDLVGLSGLLTTTSDAMRATVELLRSGVEEGEFLPPIIIGGGMVDESVCRFVGADSWAPDAASGLRLCRRLLAR